MRFRCILAAGQQLRRRGRSPAVGLLRLRRLQGQKPRRREQQRTPKYEAQVIASSTRPLSASAKWQSSSRLTCRRPAASIISSRRRGPSLPMRRRRRRRRRRRCPALLLAATKTEQHNVAHVIPMKQRPLLSTLLITRQGTPKAQAHLAPAPAPHPTLVPPAPQPPPPHQPLGTDHHPHHAPSPPTIAGTSSSHR